jgi:hypothetical protein
VGEDAVAIAEQTVFVVTGLFRELADSSAEGPSTTSGGD